MYILEQSLFFLETFLYPKKPEFFHTKKFLAIASDTEINEVIFTLS